MLISCESPSGLKGMKGFIKLVLLLCLVLFHTSDGAENSEMEASIKSLETTTKQSMEKMELEQKAIKDLLAQLLEENTNAVQTTNSLLRQYLNRTEETRNEANGYLGNMTNHLEHLKNKTLPRTFQGLELEYLSEIEEEQSSGEATIHIFEKEVREPVEALGFLKLPANYTAKESPTNATVSVWMEPMFVSKIDSMNRRMALEMKLDLMWADDRVTWTMKSLMTPGRTFAFAPSILE